MPLILAIIVRSKTRALLYGTIPFWMLMVAGAQYNLDIDPQYNSMAPGISIVAGWIPGLIYAGVCVSAVAAISAAWKRFSPDK